jgi:hypothetical protein
LLRIQSSTLAVNNVRGISHRKSIAAPLALLAFWSGMAGAAHAYPGGYDWLYQTISVLLYPDQNPHGYLWAWAGVELCGVLGFAWTVPLARRAENAMASRPSSGIRSLQFGFLCMCFTVLPARLLPFPRGHELFALLAFLGLCFGVTVQLWIAMDRRQLLPWLPLIPLVLAASTQAYLSLERPELPWVNPHWRTLGISPWLSFGFWEWISCAVLSVCLLTLWHSHPPAKVVNQRQLLDADDYQKRSAKSR